MVVMVVVVLMMMLLVGAVDRGRLSHHLRNRFGVVRTGPEEDAGRFVLFGVCGE